MVEKQCVPIAKSGIFERAIQWRANDAPGVMEREGEQKRVRKSSGPPNVLTGSDRCPEFCWLLQIRFTVDSSASTAWCSAGGQPKSRESSR